MDCFNPSGLGNISNEFYEQYLSSQSIVLFKMSSFWVEKTNNVIYDWGENCSTNAFSSPVHLQVSCLFERKKDGFLPNTPGERGIETRKRRERHVSKHVFFPKQRDSLHLLLYLWTTGRGERILHQALSIAIITTIVWSCFQIITAIAWN